LKVAMDFSHVLVYQNIKKGDNR
jgi:hypothetical protein